MSGKTEKPLVSFRLDQLRPLKGKPTGVSEYGTDWDRLATITDAEIRRAVAEDPDAAPVLNEKFWRNAAWIDPKRNKASLTIRLDYDSYHWFRETGPGYQTRMNAVLKAYVAAQKALVKSKAKK